MKEFIRYNCTFVGKGSRLDPLNQRCTIVEYFPAQAGVLEDSGKCTQIMLDVEEAESLHAYLGVWLQEQDTNG